MDDEPRAAASTEPSRRSPEPRLESSTLLRLLDIGRRTARDLVELWWFTARVLVDGRRAWARRHVDRLREGR